MTTYSIINSRKQLAYDPPPVRVRRERAAQAPASATTTLIDFVEATTQIILEPWQRMIADRLEAMGRQKGQRLLIHGPPQYGKSILISQRWPAHILGCNPLRRVRLACYNLTHAERFSKVNLSIMQSADYRLMFPSPDSRVPERVAAEEWSTAARGALLDANPSFKALGLGTGFTGLGVDDLIIDDPYKNREEALSDATNANVWGWWTDVVLPRMNPATNVVVMFHRWQDEDLAGKLIAQGGWEYLRFAAIADGDNDPMERDVGELLSPRYPLAYLEDVKRKQGNSFYALYQGTPRPPEGDYFKRGWFISVGALPVGCVFVRYWDLAAGVTDRADQTAGVLMARDKAGYYYIVDVQCGRWAASERNATILQRAHLDRQQYGVIETHIEQAPGLGKEPTEDLVRQLAGFSVYADKVSIDKESRAQPFQAQAQAGNVRILDALWNGPYLDEMCSFPTGAHDDRVDGTSGAFNRLALLRSAPIVAPGAIGQTSKWREG